MQKADGEQIRIVVLDGYALNPGDLSWTELEKLGDLTVYDRTPPELVRSRTEGAQAVFTNKTVLDRGIIMDAASLRFIGELATGYNNIDITAARERGIPVANVPAYSTDSVVQMTFALLLEICLRVGEHAKAVREGEWAAAQDFCFWHGRLTELAGKTMGIIGCGRIGKAVARAAAAFGMQVIGCGRHRVDDPWIRNVDREELLKTADVISLHCPLNEESRGMIDSNAISKMKDGVILLNTARGPLVEDKALAEALISGKVAAAGLDVATTEPIDAANPLLTAPNCYMTPHIAWATQEARIRLMHITAENLRAFLRGNPCNIVN